MVLVGSSKVRVCQDRTSRRGCGTKDCPCPVLSCPSAPALTSSSKSSWGWAGGPIRAARFARSNLPAAAPMASPPRAMRRRCAQGHGLRAALAAPSPRNLHLGRGVHPSLPRSCRPSRATHPARASSLPSACGSPRPHTSRRGSGAVPRSPACCGSGTPDGRCRPSPRRSRAARRGR